MCDVPVVALSFSSLQSTAIDARRPSTAMPPPPSPSTPYSLSSLSPRPLYFIFFRPTLTRLLSSRFIFFIFFIFTPRLKSLSRDACCDYFCAPLFAHFPLPHDHSSSSTPHCRPLAYHFSTYHFSRNSSLLDACSPTQLLPLSYLVTTTHAPLTAIIFFRWFILFFLSIASLCSLLGYQHTHDLLAV